MMGEYKEMEKVPEGWRRVRLGEILEEVKERNSKNLYSNVFTISNDLGFVLQGEFFGRLLASKDTKKYKVTRNFNFAFNPARINVGSIALNETHMTGILSPMYAVFKTKEDKLIPKFLKYHTQRKYFNSQVISNTAGSVRESLSYSALSTFHFILPPLPEQIKISEILETVDNAIEKTERIIEKYRRMKQGLMHDLLTRGIDENSNIRNEKTHKFKDSPIGRIPEEWEVVYVIQVAELNPKIDINSKKLYPFIEMDAVPIMGKHYKYITYRKGIEAGSKFMCGDILIARITPCAENGKSLLVPKDIAFGIGSTEFIVFRAKELINNEFLFYLLTSDLVRTKAIGLMEGTSGRQRIPDYVFEKIIKVPVPSSKSEQQRIASILSQIDETIEKETAYKEKLQRLKSGLMEDLLTGRVRVNNLVKEAYDEKD